MVILTCSRYNFPFYVRIVISLLCEWFCPSNICRKVLAYWLRLGQYQTLFTQIYLRIAISLLCERCSLSSICRKVLSNWLHFGQYYTLFTQIYVPISLLMFCQKVLSCRNLLQCAFIWGYFWAILNPIRINRRSHPTFTDLRKGPTICAFAVKCLQIG